MAECKTIIVLKPVDSQYLELTFSSVIIPTMTSTVQVSRVNSSKD